MFCTEAATHDSAPLGATTVTAGAVLSIARGADVPIAEGSVALVQSRRMTSSITTVPVPPAAVLLTARLNSVPLVAWVPHGAPNVALSISYDPSPLSTTARFVVPPSDDRNAPSV